MSGNIISKKDKTLFLYGVAVGLAGGYLSNVAVTTIYRFIDKDYSFTNILALILSNIFIFGICIWILKNKFKI